LIWLDYETEKKLISQKDLTPEQYEKEIKELIKRLEIQDDNARKKDI
jgi:UDP-N-acetylglucosamine:LPS N-acetylglucosamine transferase